MIGSRSSDLDQALPAIVPAYRPHQEEAIRFALRAFRDGTEVVIFEAPTGFGKSVANVSIAQGAGPAFYTTPQVTLVDQIAEDQFLEGYISPIYGKDNYQCILPGFEDRTVSLAPCEKGMPCQACGGKGQAEPGVPCPQCHGRGGDEFNCHLGAIEQPCPVCRGGESRAACSHCYGNGRVAVEPRCPYYRDKVWASQGRITVMTLAYCLLATTPELEPQDAWGLVKGRFPPRALLVVDEAHGVADFASKFISFTLSSRTLSGEAWDATWREIRRQALAVLDEADAADFLEHTLSDALKSDLKVLRERRRDLTVGSRPYMAALRAEEDLRVLMDRVDLALEDIGSGNPWAVDPRPQEDKLILQPVLIGPFLRRRLWNRADRYLLSTATVMDLGLFLRELGLEDRTVAYKQIPSTFPPERAPVIDKSVGILSKEHKQRNLPRALAQLCAILGREPERGLVHCHSYDNALFIKEHVPARYRPRLYFHESKDRSDVLEKWQEDGRPDSVLVSVAMTEGLDLRDDLARWAVIWKVPYPYLGDKRVKRRKQLHDGDHWYRLTTLRTIIQASGRIIRSEEDWGRVYILDSSVHKLLRETRKWIPGWFAARLRAGDFPGFAPPSRPSSRW